MKTVASVGVHVVLIALMGTSLVVAQRTTATAGIPDAEIISQDARYVTGHAGLKTFDATLVLDKNTLHVIRRFRNGELLTIPLSIITKISTSTERENYFGLVSANAVRNQDYVTITTETDDVAEALVFMVGQKQAEGVKAKIEFAMKKANERHE